MGIAPAEVDGGGETVGLVLTALKGMGRGTGFPLFANFTSGPEVGWFLV